MRAYLSLVNPFALIVASALVGATAGGTAVAVGSDRHARQHPAVVQTHPDPDRHTRPGWAPRHHDQGRSDRPHAPFPGPKKQRPAERTHPAETAPLPAPTSR